METFAEGTFIVTPPHPIVVDTRVAEVQVAFENTLSQSVYEATLGIRPARQASAFAVTPSLEEGGYVLGEVEPGQQLTRTFCVRPVEAEVGRKYTMHVVLQYRIRREQTRGQECVLSEVMEPPHEFHIDVEARPEVYAVIGALETLRGSLEKTYESFVDTGRSTHKDLKTALPRGEKVDIPRVALSKGSFKFLLEAVEVGSRLLNIPLRRSEKDGGDGGDGNSSP